MAYIVVDNKSKSYTNILINTDTKKRVFTKTSALYHMLSNNFDVVEMITDKVEQMKKNDVIKSIQTVGREKNKALKKIAFQVFDTLGWDQHQFDLGFDYINETYYDRIPESLKFDYADKIEEAFFTMVDRKSFYQFLREYTEGSIKAKEHMIELLSELLYGIKFNEMMNQYYNDTCGVNEE